MSEQKITITATPSKAKSVSVSNATIANKITATPDTSLYYSNLSKQWAIKMDGLVVGEDYSSKYYAENARIHAETAKMEASTVNGLIPELQENFNNYNSTLNETADNAITEINTNRDYAITQVNTTSTEAVSIVEQTASKAISDVGTLSGKAVSEINTSKNTALTKITQEAQKQMDNIESTGFYMRDDKLYFINSEGVETEFESGGGSGYALGDIVQKDHILSFEESEGLALLGTYVYKNGVAGSRYGYADFYNKYLEEYQDSVLVEKPWTQPILSANGTLGGDSFACFSSSEHSSPYVAYKAFNGNISDLTSTGTYWCSSAKTGTQFVGFYNPEPIKVTALRLYNNRGSQNDGVIATGTIQGSNDNDTYTDLGTFSGNTYGTTYIDVDLSSNTSFYKYYRIVANTYTGNYATMGEVVITATSKSAYYQNANGHKFYPISQKSYFDELFESTGEAWFYGIDTANERIFLPRNKYLSVTGDVSVAGNGMTLGLTDGTRNVGLQHYGTSGANNLNVNAENYGTPIGTSHKSGAMFTGTLGVTEDPTKSGIEGQLTSNENIYFYMVVGNTPTEKAQTDVTEITTSENDTLPLFHNFYSKEDMTTTGAYINASLGSYLSGNVYPTAYNELVNKLGTGNVKANTDTYTDYDFVVNQDDMTFRLPLKNGQEIMFATGVKGNGMTLGLTDGTNIAGITQVSDNGGSHLTPNRALGEVGNANTTTSLANNKAYGVSTDPTKSGIVLDTENITIPDGWNLYYKVANAVTNIEILDVAKVTADLNTKISRTECPSYVVETYVNGASWYRVWSDGWCEQGSTSVNTAATFVATFLKKYKTTDYTLNVYTRGGDNDDGGYGEYPCGVNGGSPYDYGQSTTGFRCSTASNTLKITWVASGYIA